MRTPQIWKLSERREIALDRPVIMAILNITPDSFSDGGTLNTDERVVSAARDAIVGGARILDIGGESTRPGSTRVSADEQMRRVVPAIRAVRAALGDDIAITIDTTLSAVAAAAIDAGADAINDVSAGLDDPAMFTLAARHGRGVIVMHRRVRPEDDVYSTQYDRDTDADDIVARVAEFLRSRAEAAVREGVGHNEIVIDPGLGFGKSVEQNLELIARTRELCGLGYPVLSGISRKSFTAPAAGLTVDTPPTQRVHASVGLSIAHMLSGARIFRVHDVLPHAQALHAAWRGLAIDR